MADRRGRYKCDINSIRINVRREMRLFRTIDDFCEDSGKLIRIQSKKKLIQVNNINFLKHMAFYYYQDAKQSENL